MCAHKTHTHTASDITPMHVPQTHQRANTRRTAITRTCYARAQKKKGAQTTRRYAFAHYASTVYAYTTRKYYSYSRHYVNTRYDRAYITYSLEAPLDERTMHAPTHTPYTHCTDIYYTQRNATHLTLRAYIAGHYIYARTSIRAHAMHAHHTIGIKKQARNACTKHMP